MTPADREKLVEAFEEQVIRDTIEEREVARLALLAAMDDAGSRTLRRAVTDWLKDREWAEDCSCDAGEWGTCWYHLSKDEQGAERIASAKKALRGLLAAMEPVGEVHRVVEIYHDHHPTVSISVPTTDGWRLGQRVRVSRVEGEA